MIVLYQNPDNHDKRICKTQYFEMKEEKIICVTYPLFLGCFLCFIKDAFHIFNTKHFIDLFQGFVSYLQTVNNLWRKRSKLSLDSEDDVFKNRAGIKNTLNSLIKNKGLIN